MSSNAYNNGSTTELNAINLEDNKKRRRKKNKRKNQKGKLEDVEVYF